MSAKQIKYFGTRRQKAGLRNRRRGRRRNQGGVVTQAEHAAERAIRTVERAAEDAIGTVTHAVNRGGRRRNVGEIITVLPANPGRRRNRRRRRKNMAARARNRRRRTNRARNRTYRRRRNPSRRMYNRRHRRRNRRSNPRIIYRTRNRRRYNRRHNRRRNQGLGGDGMKVAGVLGGAVVTQLITGFLPSSITSGTIGYVTSGVTAIVLGQVIGRAMKNRSLGTFITVGGLMIPALGLLSQFVPQLNLPFHLAGGTSGMGLITSSNFYVPQVNLPGSMATFVTPAGIPQPVAVPASTLRGLGQGASPLIGLRSARRTGRLR